MAYQKQNRDLINRDLFAEKDALHSCNDDSIFRSIDMPQSVTNIQRGNSVEKDLISSNISVDLFNEDYFCGECEENEDECKEQNTQKFLYDVSNVPNVQKYKIFGITDGANISKTSLESNVLHGSQYKTSEEIHHSKIVTTGTLSKALTEKKSKDLSNIHSKIEGYHEVDNFMTKGNFYDLPDKVKHLIFDHKGIQSLYEWQEECLNLPAISRRKNLIYALPTSGGKTLVAEILMLREIICREKNVLFILPYVSIVQEKVSALSPFAIALNFIVEEYTSGKGKCPPLPLKKRRSIFIASIEKGAMLLDSLIDAERANEIGLVVIDELHLIGEKGRGATLESLLTKIMFLKVDIQIVGMSATIGNIYELSTFLNADVYTRGFRPVELKEYLKCGNDILEINAAGSCVEEMFIYRRSVNFNYSKSIARSDPDHLAGLVNECSPENCCLIFCPSRKNCENVASLLSWILPKTKFLEHRRKEKSDLIDAMVKVCGVLSPVMAKTIPYGIAYHHAGLTGEERKYIEAAYRFGVISVICCTSSLAAGVNLPAKRVIIRSPYVGKEFISLCKYKQMVGRAGRAGMGETGESILITSCRDNIRVGEMLFSPMDKVISNLAYENGIGLQSLILSSIGLNIAICRRDLLRLINTTLLAVQAEQLDISTEQLALSLVRLLIKNKILQICSNDKGNSSGNCTTRDAENGSKEATMHHIYISKTTRLRLTPIGKAAFKAGIDYKHTYAICNELHSAAQRLILTNYSHLLYLVVCFLSNKDGDEMFPADPVILFRLYDTLDPSTQMLFRLLGLSESHVVKIGKTLSVHGPLESKVNRLYKVLILMDVLNMVPIPNVASKYNIERGMLQNFINQSIMAANTIVRLCEQVDEFWCFKALFERVSAKMDRCGKMELEPLLHLPAVKINRAKQLYGAGFRTIEDIAKCRPMQLVKCVEHMPLKSAKEIISAAKIILMNKLNHLEEETESLRRCLEESC